jgi:hypothetical protein
MTTRDNKYDERLRIKRALPFHSQADQADQDADAVNQRQAPRKLSHPGILGLGPRRFFSSSSPTLFAKSAQLHPPHNPRPASRSSMPAELHLSLYSFTCRTSLDLISLTGCDRCGRGLPAGFSDGGLLLWPILFKRPGLLAILQSFVTLKRPLSLIASGKAEPRGGASR